MLATLWPDPPEIRAPEGRGISKSIDVTVPSSIDPDGLCRAQRTTRTPSHSTTLSIPFMLTINPTLFLPAGFQLAVTVLLAIVPFVSATFPLQHSRKGLDSVNQQRDAGPLPAGWAQLVACATDNPNQPTLTSYSFLNPYMTVVLCVNACASSYLAVAGLKNGNSCFCGNITTDGATETSSNNCLTPCVGNLKEFCGGPNSLTLYWNGFAFQPSPTFTQSVGVWNFKGCYSDSKDARTLVTEINVSDSEGGVTVEKCVDGCGSSGYSHAGVEFANECWCGISINPSGMVLDSKLCSVLACSGNSFEYCGGAHTMIIYNLPPRIGS